MITNRTLGDFYYYIKEYDLAEEQLIKTLKMDSAFNYAHAYLGLVYIQKSLCDLGLEELQKEIDYGLGTSDIALAWKGYTYGICGDLEQGREILASFLNRSEPEFHQIVRGIVAKYRVKHIFSVQMQIRIPPSSSPQTLINGSSFF